MHPGFHKSGNSDCGTITIIELMRLEVGCLHHVDYTTSTNQSYLWSLDIHASFHGVGDGKRKEGSLIC